MVGLFDGLLQRTRSIQPLPSETIHTIAAVFGGVLIVVRPQKDGGQSLPEHRNDDPTYVIKPSITAL